MLDQEPPVVTAALVPVGEVDDDEGRFRIEFSCGDICDASVSTTAELNGIPVVYGQLVNLELDDDTEVESDDGVLEFEAPAFTLAVTCTDASGNEGSATATPAFPSDDDDDDDDD